MQQLKDLLDQAQIMQLATATSDGQPWICSVYFVYDDQLNVYWLSYPERRHSQELAQNARAAVTMPIKVDLPVISLSAEGSVTRVHDEQVVQKIMERYVAKYGEGRGFYERFLAGSNKHVMYQLTPQHYILFDEVHHTGAAARQQIDLP